MKLAELHDGKVIAFPADMDDGMMDKMVKAALGISDGPDPKQEILMEGAKAMLAFAQEILNGQELIRSELAKLRESTDRLCNATASNGEIIKQSALLNHAGLQELGGAYKARRKIVTDKSGKPTAVEVE